MRFRAKFGLFGWFWVGMAFCQMFFWLDSAHRSFIGPGLNAVIFSLFAIAQLLKRYFIYWELDSEGIHEHRYWHKRDVAWGLVTDVVNSMPGIPWEKTLTVWFYRSASKSRYRSASKSRQGALMINPIHRKQLIQALHEFAPKATIKIDDKFRWITRTQLSDW